MALTKGEKIICADVVTEDLLKRCGNNQDVSFDLTVQDRDGDMKSEFIIDSDEFRYYQFNDSNSNGVDIEIDAEKALIQIKHEYDGGDVFSTNNLELSVAGSHLRNKNSGGETGDLCVHGDELTFNGNKVFVDDGDTYLVINETSSVDSITEMYRDGSGNGKPAHFGCFSSDVGDDIGIGSDGVYLCMPYGTDSENYGHIIAGDDECDAGDASLYHAALDSDGGIGRWRRILDSENYTDYISGGGTAITCGSKSQENGFSTSGFKIPRYNPTLLQQYGQRATGYFYIKMGKIVYMTITLPRLLSVSSEGYWDYTLPFTFKSFSMTSNPRANEFNILSGCSGDDVHGYSRVVGDGSARRNKIEVYPKPISESDMMYQDYNTETGRWSYYLSDNRQWWQVVTIVGEIE